MTVSSTFQAHVQDQLGRVVPDLRPRRMFGAVGLYAGELFFALIADDTLYFKADSSTRAAFEARGMSPFRPFGDLRASMHYYQLPDDLLEDPDALRPWVENAVASARRAKGRPRRRRDA